VPHLIYALHGLAFFVLFDLVLLLFCAHVFRFKSLGDGYSMFILACFGVYNSLAIRRAYGFSTSKAVLGGIYAIVTFLILLVLYRQLMTVITLMTY
jgi:ABC-type nickel/cobalt efflux system permease component RcnA